MPESRGPGVQQFSGNHTKAENATMQTMCDQKGVSTLNFLVS